MFLAAERGERRHQEAELTDARTVREQLDEPLPWPPATRQTAIERSEARRQTRWLRRTALVTGPPDTGMPQQFVDRGHDEGATVRG